MANHGAVGVDTPQSIDAAVQVNNGMLILNKTLIKPIALNSGKGNLVY